MIILQLDSKQLSNIVQSAVHEALIAASYPGSQNSHTTSSEKGNKTKIKETIKQKGEVADGQ